MYWQLFMSSCRAEASGFPCELWPCLLWHGGNWEGCCSRWCRVLGGWSHCCGFTLSDHTGTFQPWFQSCMKASWELRWDTLLPESLCPLPVIPLPSPHMLSHGCEPFFSGNSRNSLWSPSLFCLSVFSPGTWWQNQVKDEREMPLLFSLPLCLSLLGDDLHMT